MPTPQKTDKEMLRDQQEIIRAKNAEINALTRDLRKVEREEDSRESIREQIMGLMARSPEPPAWIDRHKGSGQRGVPTCLWTDWHMGEVVNPDIVGGLNKFNETVAKRRAATLVDVTVELAYEHMGRAKYEYPGAVVMLGGDMITGNIHPDLSLTNDMTNQRAINVTTDLLASCIERMASKFGKLFIPCVTGNHPRDTSYSRRRLHSLPAYTSHEWVIYCNLERHFKTSKHVQFMIPGGTDAIFSVVGHRYLLTHGDNNGVKGGDGIIGALGPIVRGALKVHDSEAQVGVDIDTLVMGHWHQRVDIDGIIVGNSFIGYNSFGRSGLRAKFTTPSQLLWFTHPKYGITARWPVYLEPKLKGGRNDAWVSWKTDGRHKL